MHCYLGSWKSAFISLLKENCLMQHFWLVLYSLSTLHISSQSPHVYEGSTRYTYVESLLEFPFHIMSHGFIVIFNILPCYLFFNHFRHMNHNHHYPHFPVLYISSFIHVKSYLIHSCTSVIKYSSYKLHNISLIYINVLYLCKLHIISLLLYINVLYLLDSLKYLPFQTVLQMKVWTYLVYAPL